MYYGLSQMAGMKIRFAKKIRSSYRTSWANGEFPSGQMAYGYEKDKDNPHQLIPDPVAAPVVKKIFQYFIDGMTYAEIARKLNADGYLCPKAYKLDKAGKANEKSATWTWSGGTVHKILENQYYAGDSVHNQFTNDSWAAQRQKMNQKEEWIIIKNTHGGLAMAVSYKRLWIKLAEKEMSRADLRKKAEIAPNTMTKLGKNEYVAMPILDKICKKLGTDYGEIMEYVPDKEESMGDK